MYTNMLTWYFHGERMLEERMVNTKFKAKFETGGLWKKWENETAFKMSVLRRLMNIEKEYISEIRECAFLVVIDTGGCPIISNIALLSLIYVPALRSAFLMIYVEGLETKRSSQSDVMLCE